MSDPDDKFKPYTIPEWTNHHPDGSMSYAKVEPVAWLLWRIILTRTNPAPEIESVQTHASAFGTYWRARRKADRLLSEWDAMHERYRRDFAEGLERGMRARMWLDDV